MQDAQMTVCPIQCALPQNIKVHTELLNVVNVNEPIKIDKAITI